MNPSVEKKEYSLKDIQNSIYSVMMYVDDFCRKNGIEYYLMGGSALGAMRHKGFIPWDDDLDIFMTVDNYEKFIHTFELVGDKEKYFLQKENTEEWPLFLSRVCLNGTTMVSDEFKFNMKQHHSIFVDIMCLYSAPGNSIARWMQYMAAQMLRVNALARCGFPNESLVKRIVLVLSKIIVNPLTRIILIKYVRQYENRETSYMGHYFGRARFKKCAFPRAFLGKPRYVPFESAQLPVFEKVEDYLKTRFGDKWMEMPSQEVKNQYPVHGNFVDLEKDYSFYMSPDKTKWIYE